MRSNLFVLICFALTLVAAPAPAQVVNGDFGDGLNDWTSSLPTSDWIAQTSTANPLDGAYATITSPFFGDGGLGCLNQTFECGQPDDGQCTIRLFYRLDLFDAGPNSGLIRVRANGVEQFESPTTIFSIDWTEVVFNVPCGPVELELCLDAFPGNQAWIAGFDGVTATCDQVVSDHDDSWSAVKALY